ncbi:hypothetical protein ILUMI_04268 [Ignelater luminosus]|uniref:Leucine-rich PPR motif-containing protein, mitochondrial n=1 Tax=Ignelater luminosus TaxID=2038154 RepID=A0A8K0DF19_IGNLU|nr:hypothetical protein ILUMI_04268 [Ignelater luminosus]
MYRYIRLWTGVSVHHFNTNKNYFFKNMRIEHRKQFLGRRLENQNFLIPSTALNKRELKTHSALYNQEVSRAFVALSTAYNKQSRIYSSNILHALENFNPKLIDNNQSLLLLQCCGYMIADQTLQARAELCNKVWTKLEEYEISMNLEHYNTYLQVCIENQVALDFEEFLSKMKCKPNKETYNLLLECACEVGDVQQAVKIVAAMKSIEFPADERMFDALVLGHSIKGGFKSAQTVLENMQAAHVPVTSRTYFSIIRGLGYRNNLEELMQALQMYSGVIKEQEILSLLMVIGLNGNYKWLKQILQITGPIRLSKRSIQQLDLLCINLIHSGQPEAAIEFYKTIVNVPLDDDTENYAFFLLIEMLHTFTSPKILIDVAKDLQRSGLNPFALENITGIALRRGFYKVAWELLESFSRLRPHYFWPLLLQAEKQNREIGVLNVIEKMLDWNVKMDLDTLEFYCLPYCDTMNPQLLITRLQNLGFSIKELLTPFLGFLLKESRIKDAQELYKAYDNVSINSERLLSPLVKAWHNSSNSGNIVRILKKFCKSASVSTDYLGHFLLRCLRLCDSPEHHEQFLELLKAMHVAKLYISLSTSDSLIYRMKLPSHQTQLNTAILEEINNLSNVSIPQNNNSHIPHPRNMNVSELECHLIELQNKNMEVRGVLRRLIQEYARTGDEKKVNELRQKFSNAGYVETAGMKAALMYSYITNDNVDSALKIYDEVKKTSTSFFIDSFKVLDLATLLIKNNQFNKAIDILENETKDRCAQGGPTIVRNCWQLITAAADEVQAEKLFNLLVEKGYCVPSNIILGPLVKVYLKKGNLTKAVEVFTNFAQKYNCTPLQVELLYTLVKAENERLMQDVLNVTTKVHGTEAANLSLVTVLAQSGLHRSLRKFIIEVKGIDKRQMEKRCKRWVKEDNLFALQTLSTATYQLSTDLIDRSIIHQYIMQIHSINNDCESAVKFYQELLEKEEFVPQQLIDDMLSLVSRCKYKMPEVHKTKKLY